MRIRSYAWTVLVAACALNSQPGSGEKVGQIIKLKREGIFSKTWEAELIRGGMTNGSGAFGVAPFDFTIESDSLVAVVKRAMESQTEVLITYRTEGVYSCWRSGQGQGDFLLTIRPTVGVMP